MNEAELLIVNISICLLLVIIAGTMSGLTVGLLSIDDLDMELALAAGDENEKKYAKKVLPIITKHHLLLVTLLLANASAMEALPIFLNELVPEYAAILISVTFILIFGEVLPQAICTGPDQIKIAACMVPIIKLIMFILYPISKPIALILDKALKSEGQKRYTREHLKALIQMHTQKANELVKEIQNDHKKDEWPQSQNFEKLNFELDSKIKNNTVDQLQLFSQKAKNQKEEDNIKSSKLLTESQEQPLLEKETNLIIGALDIREKTVQNVLKPFDKVFTIDSETVLNFDNVKEILRSNYSRIPVYKKSRENVIGVLLIKDLAVYCHENQKEVKTFEESGIKYYSPVVAHPEAPLLDLLPQFTQGRCHLALVTEQDYKLKSCIRSKQDFNGTILGIVTLEDVIEVLLKQQIYDEHDQNKLSLRTSLKLFSISRSINPRSTGRFFYQLYLSFITFNSYTSYQLSIPSTKMPTLLISLYLINYLQVLTSQNCSLSFIRYKYKKMPLDRTFNYKV